MILIGLLQKIKERFHHKDIDEEIDEVFGKTRAERVLEADRRMQERAQPPSQEQLNQLPPKEQQAELRPTYDVTKELREPARPPLKQPVVRKENRDMALPNIPVLEEKRPAATEMNKIDLEALLLELRSIKAQNDLVLQHLKKIEETIQRFI